MTMILMVKVKSKCMIMWMMTNYDDNLDTPKLN